MHAVIVDVSINDFEQSQHELKDRVVPMVSQMPGFVAGYWMSPQEGAGHSVVMFESEEQANEMAGRVRSNTPPTVEIRNVTVSEVVASA